MIRYTYKLVVHVAPSGDDIFEVSNDDELRKVLYDICSKYLYQRWLDYIEFFAYVDDKIYYFTVDDLESLKVFITGFLVTQTVVSKLSKKNK